MEIARYANWNLWSKLIAASMLCLSSGCPAEGPTTGPIPVGRTAANYNDYSASLPSWQEFATAKGVANKDEDVPTGEPVEHKKAFEGLKYTCTTTPYSLTETPEKIVTLDPDVNVFWVGSLLQGEGYINGIGSLKELPIRQRAPINLSISVPFDGNRMVVEEPTFSHVQQAVGRLISAADASGVKPGTSTDFKVMKSDSLNEFALHAGMSAKFWGVSVKASLDVDKKREKSKVTAQFVQNMFTISMDAPQTPAAVFNDELTQELLQEQIGLGNLGEDNVPVYVSSISYGRVFIINTASNASADKLKAALEVQYGKKFKADADAEYEKTLREMEIRVSAIGGTEEAIRDAVIAGDLKSYLEKPFPLSSARPISYEIRNLGDGSIAKISETTSYNVTECSVGAAIPKEIGDNVPLDKFVPPSTGSGRDFNGRGPVIHASARLLGVGTRVLRLRLRMTAQEENRPGETRASGFRDYELWRAPRGHIITSIETDTESHQNYVDTDHKDDIFTGAPADLVSKWTFVGDKRGNEAGSKTGVTISLNDIKLTYAAKN